MQTRMLAINVSIPNPKIARLVQFDRDNSMYEQQTWMLTLGLPNRNTGCHRSIHWHGTVCRQPFTL